LLLLAVPSSAKDEHGHKNPHATSPSLTDDPQVFKKVAVPLLRRFIFSQYDKFAESELTFRHLKTHLSEELGIPYRELKRDDISEVVEDATDEIANNCNMGETPLAKCKIRIGYTDVHDERTEL
jgi:hypothetical protein